MHIMCIRVCRDPNLSSTHGNIIADRLGRVFTAKYENKNSRFTYPFTYSTTFLSPRFLLICTISCGSSLTVKILQKYSETGLRTKEPFYSLRCAISRENRKKPSKRNNIETKLSAEQQITLITTFVCSHLLQHTSPRRSLRREKEGEVARKRR